VKVTPGDHKLIDIGFEDKSIVYVEHAIDHRPVETSTEEDFSVCIMTVIYATGF
jgi:hypothetical protein